MSLGFERKLETIGPEPIFYIGSFPVMNSTITIILIALIFLFVGIFVFTKFKQIPGKFQSIIEMVFEFTLDLVQQITGSEDQARKIFPVIATILIYLVVANIIVLVIPFLPNIMYDGHHLFRSPASDFNTTLGMALAAVIALNFISLRENGIFGYLNHFINIKAVVQGFKKGVMGGFIGLIEFFVGLLHIVGEFGKIVSLSFRLFGNVYAKSILMIVITGIFAYALPSFFMALGGFLGILQGFVFAALVAVYYSQSLKSNDGEHH